MKTESYYEVHLQDYLYILKKRKFIFFFFFILSLFIGVFYTINEKVIYRSTGTLLIERDNPNIVDFKEVMAFDASSSDYYQTQYQMLKSRSLMKRLIKRENLEEDSYLQTLQKGRLRRILRENAPWLTEKLNAFFTQKDLEDILIKYMLHVDPIRNSRLVQVSVLHPDPERSVSLTNSLLESFIERSLEERYLISRRAEELISGQLVKIKERVVKAEQELQLYKEKHGLVNIPSLREENEFLQDARLELVKIQAEESKLAKRYLPAHPKRIHIRSQIEGLEEKIVTEEKRNMGLSRLAVDYSELEREAESARQVYQALLTRLEETSSESQAQASNIMIVDQAELPKRPYRPRPILNILAAIAIGLLGGVCLVFFLEYFDSTIKIPDDVEKGLGLPLFGIIPQASPRLFKKKQKSFFDVEPHSATSESVRALRTDLLFKTRHIEGCRTLLMTSPNPEEGKSTLIFNLAIALAQNNLKVLLMDGDLRKPSMHKFMEVPLENGLGDILEDDKKFEEVVHKNIKGLDFLSAGTPSTHPAEVLGSRQMETFMKAVKEEYDFILIDSSPYLAVADVIVLSEHVQAIVFVARYYKTDKRHLRDIKRRFEHIDEKVWGVVINQVSVKERDYYYHQYYYYGYGNVPKKK